MPTATLGTVVREPWTALTGAVEFTVERLTGRSLLHGGRFFEMQGIDPLQARQNLCLCPPLKDPVGR